VAKAVEDLLTQMKTNPTGVRYVDACKVAEHFFGPPRQNGTSHRVWKMPWPGDPRINLQEGKGGKAKAYQVRQALAAIERFNQMTAGMTKTSALPTRTEKDHAPSDARE
jgi:hypothetical protein